jgi:flagella basal body P-ring formation protein FlgA
MKPYAFLDNPYPLLKELVYNLETTVATGTPGLPSLGLDKLVITKPSLVPVRTIRQALDKGLDKSSSGSFTLAGRRIALIPTMSVPRQLLIFYRELLLFLDTLESYQDGRLELDITDEPALLAALTKNPTDFGLALQPAFKVQQLDKEQDYLSGEAFILCTFGNPARVKEPYVLHCNITQYVPVFSLREGVNKGEVLKEEQLEIAEVAVSDLEEELIKTAGYQQGRFALKKELVKGSLLKSGDLEPVPGVKAGEEINIYFTKGNIRLHMPGKAYTTGQIGTEVTVGPMDIKKRFKGIVTATQEVKVEIN